MPQDSPSRRQDQFIVRFPDGMRDRIAEVAKANGRSMNSEIIARLKASLDADMFGGRPAVFALPQSSDLNDLREHLMRFQRTLEIALEASEDDGD